MEKTTMHLMVGLPGSGKTTYAKQLEARLGALRLTPDEWHLHLYGHDANQPEHDGRHTRVEQLMWTVAQRVLAAGVSVILDYGFWSREERDGLRGQARRMGVDFKIYFMDVPLDELHRRLAERNERVGSDQVFHVTRENLEEWSGIFQPPTREELEG